MNARRLTGGGLLFMGVVISACSRSASDAPGGSPPVEDATPPDPTADAGPEEAEAAASPPIVFPRAATSGGKVIAQPRLVVITFAGDPMEPDIAKFSDALKTSAYFANAGKEYGVGAIASVVHARLTDAAPAAITDAEVRKWLATTLGATGPLGAPDASTLYAIHYPASTVVTYAGGPSCQRFDGYHGEIDASGTRVGFAVLPRCPSSDPELTTLDKLTKVASHELFEWATDPFPQTDQAWHKVVPDSAAFGLAFAAELGDLCDGRTSHTRPADLGFVVQSMWSNQASLAGHAPCQPAVLPQFVVPVPRLPDAITLSPSLMQASSASAGGSAPALIVAPGKSVDVVVHVYSETTSATKWHLSAAEGGTLPVVGLELSFDHADAMAGDDVKLTVSAPSDLRSPAVVVLYLTRAGTSASPFTRWPFIVRAP